MVWRLAGLDAPSAPILRLPLGHATGAFRWLGSELLVLDEGGVRVFAGAEERLGFDAPIGYKTPWALSPDRRFLLAVPAVSPGGTSGDTA